MTNLLDAATIQSLRGQLQGEVLRPGDDGYDQARAVWNGRYDPRPAVIIRCRNADDVVIAVNFARDSNQPLSVKGGGHSYAGYSVGDDCVAIDLTLMNDVRVDPERKTATVGPGATWADFDGKAQEHGLATTGATVSTVGVAGYTLGGGTGYLARKFGLGLDNLTAVEVVTADGRKLRASETEHEDLFWALRGGSGNFGVVTSFEFRLHDVGPEVVVAQAFHLFEDAREALRFYRDFAGRASEDVTAYAFALNVPPVEPFPAEHHGKPAMVLMACHCGDVSDGEAALRPLQDFGSPILAALQTVPYAAAQQSFDAGMPKGLRWFTRAHYLNELSDEAIDLMVKHAQVLPGPFSMAYFEPLGGAVGRVDPGSTAFRHRSAAYSLHIFPGWTDPADDEVNLAWAREFYEAVAPLATGGVYVNLLGRDEETRVPAAYGENYGRLVQLKAKWDPLNLFRNNQNIQPRPSEIESR